jgi:bacterioferritin
MEITKFVKDLNIILKMEYGAVMQYVLHAYRFSKAGKKEIAKEILILGNDEIRHAEMLANKIKEIGGKSTVSAAWSQDASDLESMLNANLRSEKKSIKVYEKLIKIAKKQKFKGLVTLLEEQLADEARHVKVLQKYLKEK